MSCRDYKSFPENEDRSQCWAEYSKMRSPSFLKEEDNTSDN